MADHNHLILSPLLAFLGIRHKRGAQTCMKTKTSIHIKVKKKIFKNKKPHIGLFLQGFLYSKGLSILAQI